MQVLFTHEFGVWLEKQERTTIVPRIAARIDNIKKKNFGDYKYLDDNLYELRFHVRSGIRIYYCIHKDVVVILLAGGNKDSQKRDITKAKRILKELDDGQIKRMEKF